MDPDQYCRELEAYLCRKNDGHLIRIVGPSFERVCGWATRGIPFKVAARGIDRYFERYYAKGPRRRPVRIDFCEADVLDVFDEWRRAVGIAGRVAESDSAAADGDGGQDGHESPALHVSGLDEAATSATSRGPSLPAHLERAIARLTVLRARPDLPDAFHAQIDRVVRELDAQRAEARHLRGEARARLLDRLRALDSELVDAAEATLDEGAREALAREAAEDLAPFRARMATDVFAGAIDAGRRRLVRQQIGLPQLAL